MRSPVRCDLDRVIPGEDAHLREHLAAFGPMRSPQLKRVLEAPLPDPRSFERTARSAWADRRSAHRFTARDRGPSIAGAPW